MFDIQIYGVKFSKRNQFGDFYWMCNLEEYSDSLFIFNDNEEYHETSRGGAGNAIMRTFNKYSKLTVPKSAGIPTGTLTYGGYDVFDEHVKNTIDNSIQEIEELINKYEYKKIYYSSEPDGLLGTSIFEVNKKVIAYITWKIHQLSTKQVQIIKFANTHFANNYDFNVFDDEDSNSDFEKEELEVNSKEL
jgi:hypothetical protein